MAKILYVEDEPLLRTLFEKALTAHGHQVESVASGREGLAKYVVGSYDVVALDHQLPDTTGIDLARKILSMNKDQPLLMVTGKGDERLAVEALTLGMANYVVKDTTNVYLELIPSIVSELLSRAESRHQHQELEQKSRASEARYKTILQALPTAVHEMDLKGRFLSVNPACGDVFPHSPGTVVSILDFCIEEHRPMLQEALDAAASDTEISIEFISDIGETTRYLSCRIAPMLKEGGHVVRTVGITHDISDKKHAEQARSDALAEAVRANAAKSGFMTAMSHEFRTPLNAIMGFSDALRRQSFGADDIGKYAEYAEHIHGSSEQMLQLVNEILDISAIEQGTRKFAKKAIPLQPLLMDCARRFERDATERGIHLKTDLPDDFLTLQADRRSVMQMVQNLLSNAIKFSVGGDTVALSARTVDDGVEFSIADSGQGIPANRLADVTEPFLQVHKDPYTSRTGWGLGLSVVKSLVDAHDGALNIQSEVGKGTTVSIKLPQ